MDFENVEKTMAKEVGSDHFMQEMLNCRAANAKVKADLEGFMLAEIDTLNESGYSDLINWFTRVQWWFYNDGRAQYIVDHISHMLQGDVPDFDFLVHHYGVVYNMLVPIYADVIAFEEAIDEVCPTSLNEEADWQIDEQEFVPDYFDPFYDDYEFDM